MKPAVPPHKKAKGVTFSLKPDLYSLLESRVEQLGYPWTKSSYIASLVMKDLEESGLLEKEAASGDSSWALPHAAKAIENTKKWQAEREQAKAKKKSSKSKV